MRSQQSSAVPMALALGVLLSIAGCSSSPGGEASESPASPTTAENSAPAQSTQPATGSAAGNMPASSAATGSSVDPMTGALTLFYVAVGDEGKSGPKIGCGDSLVATETGPVEFTNQIEASMIALLDDDEQELGGSGLRNALASSDLDYISSTVKGDSVSVELSGTVSSGGICDDPRMIGQLEYTAMTAAGTGQAQILVNGEKLEEVLSAK